MIKKIWPILLGILLLGVAGAIILTAKKVKAGDSITISYTLTLDDGTVYYTSPGDKPLKATLGKSILLPSFEEQLIGMRVGESKTFTLPPDKAYGWYRPDLVGTLDRSWLPEGVEPKVGKQLETELRDGTKAIAVITDFTETTLTLDANHPLVGQNLTFSIELLEIGENPTMINRNNSTVLSSILFALGALILGLVIFSRMRWPGSVIKRRNARPRST